MLQEIKSHISRPPSPPVSSLEAIISGNAVFLEKGSLQRGALSRDLESSRSVEKRQSDQCPKILAKLVIYRSLRLQTLCAMTPRLCLFSTTEENSGTRTGSRYTSFCITTLWQEHRGQELLGHSQDTQCGSKTSLIGS